MRRIEPLIGVSISLATARATASTALLAVVLTARTWLSEVAWGPSPRAAPGELGLPRGLLALLPGVQEHLVPCASGCAGQLGADGCSEAAARGAGAGSTGSGAWMALGLWQCCESCGGVERSAGQRLDV